MKIFANRTSRDDISGRERLESLVAHPSFEGWDFQFVLGESKSGGRLLISRDGRIKCQFSSFGVFADEQALMNGLAKVGARWLEQHEMRQAAA